MSIIYMTPPPIYHVLKFSGILYLHTVSWLIFIIKPGKKEVFDISVDIIYIIIVKRPMGWCLTCSLVNCKR